MKCTMKIKRVLTKKNDPKNLYRVFKAVITNVETEEGELHATAVQKEMTVKGNMASCTEGDTYDATCRIVVDKKWGVGLELISTEIKKYETEDELIKFFEKKIQGVGKKTATEIVSKLGVNAIDIIAKENGARRLRQAKIKGLGQAKIDAIKESVLFHKNFADIVLFLQMNDLDVKMANTLYEEFGRGCLIDLKTNPYKFSGYVDFKKLDDAGFKAGIDRLSMDRIKAGIKGYVQLKLDSKGDIYVSLDELNQNLADYMNRNSKYAPITEDLTVFIKEALIQLHHHGAKSNKTSKGNIIFEDKKVYRRDMYYLETRIAKRLKEINVEDKNYDFELVDTLIDVEESKTGFKLATKQRQAVHMAMKHNFFVLCGLPGAGKTSTTNLILRVFENYTRLTLNKEPEVLTMAPTGKAARRLTELCGIEAMTIHRALGLKLYEQADLNEKIEADFIVVDESSMVDIYMFFTLLEKIENGTKVMFVGDDEQLPSVGAGLILRDLIQSETITSTKLTEVFRQAGTSQIVHNSHAIIKSNTDFKFGTDTFFTNSSNDYLDFHSKIAKHYIRLNHLGYKKDEICILTPTRKGLFGTEALNKLIQTINPNKETIRANGFDMKIGDMVMQNTNDYDIEVYNGEVGEIIDFEDAGKNSTITVKFADKEVVYKKEMFCELELAYAITIHKSQGSEYRAVIFVCSSEHSAMLTKNLVYTGFTRAKEKLSIIGQQEALISSADKKTEISRKSYLVERLKGEF